MLKYLLMIFIFSFNLLYSKDEINCIFTLTNHSGIIEAIVFSPDGKYLVSGGKDKTIRIWNVLNGTCINTIPTSNVLSLAFSPDGSILAAGSDDSTIKLFDFKKCEWLKSISCGTCELTGYHSIMFNRDGSKIIGAAYSMKYRIFDIKSEKVIQTVGDPLNINCIDLSPDGSLIATGADNFQAKLWDYHSGHIVKTYKEKYENVSSVEFSPDGNHLISSSITNTTLWYIPKGLALFIMEGGMATFSPNGKLIATVDQVKIMIWNSSNGMLVQSLYGHKDIINTIAFSPIKRILASAGCDKTIKIWKIRPFEKY